MDEKREILDELIKENRYDEATRLLAEKERAGVLSVRELVLKGRCIQLGSTDALPLAEAEQSFRDALSSDPDYVPALLDLAWFYHAVESDPARALPLFRKAVEISRKSLTEAASGVAECLEEIESGSSAEKFLRETNSAALLVGDLSEEQQEMLRKK